ncbi:hypothetical protein RIF29_25526 [Crotalaria pallida]|uniref:Uncharacterized protein n=1 Tax=Crotalaria pallida TaxID=3830 RepID=A0AAN9EME3_CROPI
MYNSSNIGTRIGNNDFSCSSIPSPQGTDGINYPSMHTQVMCTNSTISAIFYRNRKKASSTVTPLKRQI